MTLLQALADGVLTGLPYAAIAAPITLIFGLSRIINFAIGEMAIVGAFSAWSVQSSTGNYLVALMVAVIVTAALAFGAERGMFRRTLDAPLTGFVVSLGLILVLQSVIVEIWGLDSRSVQAPIQGVFEMGDLVLRRQSVANAFLVLLMLVGLQLLLSRTRFGTSLRAIADDREVAALMGVEVRRVIAWCFVIGGAITGVVGWVLMTGGSISPYLGETMVLKGFAAALVGGLGDFRGAVVVAFALAIAESLAVAYGDPAWSEIYLYGLVIAVLLWRPTGVMRGLEGSEL